MDSHFGAAPGIPSVDFDPQVNGKDEDAILDAEVAKYREEAKAVLSDIDRHMAQLQGFKAKQQQSRASLISILKGHRISLGLGLHAYDTHCCLRVLKDCWVMGNEVEKAEEEIEKHIAILKWGQGGDGGFDYT